MELFEGRFLGGVVLIQPLLQRDAEAALDDGMRWEAALFEIRGRGHPAVVEYELLDGIKDRVFRPSEKGQLPG